MANTLVSSISFNDETIIITDPCYLKQFRDDAVWRNFLSKFISLENLYRPTFYNDGLILSSDTLYGDWSCTVYNCNYKEFLKRCKKKQKVKKEEILGEFCADSGLVSVCSESNYQLRDDIGDWCYTKIKKFTGTVNFYAVDCDTLIVEGIGNINFCSAQTGF